MGARLHLEIVSRERRILSTEVEEVRIPGILGELGVLPGHAPLLTVLNAGRVAYTEGSEEGNLALRQGFAEILPDQVTILAKEAVLPENVDVEAQRQRLGELSELMKSAPASELEELKVGLRFAEACLEVAGVAE